MNRCRISLYSLAGLFLLLTAAPATAREKASGDALVSVQVTPAQMLCLSEGDWCAPSGETPAPRPARITRLDDATPSPAHTASHARVASELAPPMPDLPSLQPVVVNQAAVVCHTEGTWCGLFPDDADRPDLGI